MLSKRLIPCLDVKDGRVVKGVNFVDLHDAGDPVEIAQRYDEEGADELTFLDITASHERRKIILEVVRKTAETVFMPLTVGGGVRGIQAGTCRRGWAGESGQPESAQCRRRQGIDQHCGSESPRVRQGSGRALRFTMHRRSDRRETQNSDLRPPNPGLRTKLGSVHSW